MLSYSLFRDRVAEDIETENWVYRGHADKAWSLRSAYARFCDREGIEFSLSRFKLMLGLFIDKASDLTGKDCTAMGLCEQIAFAQHHGLPTPFLDWTESPYIALYFAVSEQILNLSPEHQGTMKIWALRVNQMKLVNPVLDLEDNQLDFALVRSKIFYSRRVHRQAGCFSYLGFPGDLYEQRRNYDVDIKWYDISGDPYSILRELNLMGIGAANLFDDADGVAKEILLKTIASEHFRSIRRAT